MSTKEVIAHFNTNIEKGLSSDEANARIEKYGANELE